MTRPAALRSGLPLLGAAALVGMACETAALPCESLDSFAWMLGDWHSEAEKTVTVDRWWQVSADTFEGAGETRSKSDGALVHAESLRLVAMSGQVFFVAKTPGNARPVAFEATECADDRAVFENRAHDFPNRLAYRRASHDAIDVDVLGNDGKGFTVAYRRIGARDNDKKPAIEN